MKSYRAERSLRGRGTAYLVTLTQFAGTAAYIVEYVYILRSKCKLQKLFDLAKGSETASLKNDIDPDAFIQRYRESFNQLIELGDDILIPYPYW